MPGRMILTGGRAGNHMNLSNPAHVSALDKLAEMIVSKFDNSGLV